MDVRLVLKELRYLSNSRTLHSHRKLGLVGVRYYGVNKTKLKKVSRKYKRDHNLALKLWDTKIHDARLLATMIEDPKKTTQDQLEKWINESSFFDLTDKICALIVIKTPWAKEKISEWLANDKEQVKRAGFMVLSEIAKIRNSSTLSRKDYENYLSLIEQNIHYERNWVREAMNTALISIGKRNYPLNQMALQVAKSIGKVEVEYGETSYHVPDAWSKLHNLTF